jgi:hypothetical protein
MPSEFVLPDIEDDDAAAEFWQGTVRRKAMVATPNA